MGHDFLHGGDEPLKASPSAKVNPPLEVPLTVGKLLDHHIEVARQRVERLCVRKAKAEALNILDHPADFYMSLFSY